MAEELSVPPSLPFELERSIFETAALSTSVVGSESHACGLAREALGRASALSWLDPWNTILQHGDIHAHRRYEIRVFYAQLSCSGVENLWIMLTGTPDPASCIAVGSMSQLRHLHCDFEELCCHITHLELFHRLNDDEWAGLTGLAHLTHLSFNAYGVLRLLASTLSACKSLRALVLLRNITYASPGLEIIFQDPRFVIIPIITTHTEDWKRGALTGVDYWARADAFIAKRISGEIDRRTFFLPTDSEDS
ncbi:hypothetical protein DFH09DRAFT_1286071 [Mycena vulgaris]|nr:hypothetical protein DFH09DRAFT_1286071 [Mycena vulgaris]